MCPADKLEQAIAPLRMSARVSNLYNDFDLRYRAFGQRLYAEPESCRAWLQAAISAYRQTKDRPAALRRSRVLTEFAGSIPIVVKPEDLLLGSQAFNPAPRILPDESKALRDLGYVSTSGHIVHDYATLLQYGISGLRAEIAAAASADHEQQLLLHAFGESLDAFQHYVARHIEAAQECPDSGWTVRSRNFASLLRQPPASFEQALQLLWFAHIFLHAENPSVAISFGRLDQILWPYLESDLTAHQIDLQDAYNLIGAFLIKTCEGEESQNVVLGGVDSNGQDCSNPLSYLFLQAGAELNTFQPSFIVRIHENTPVSLWQAAVDVCRAGNGNPGFMNDAVVIPALQALDVPLERARDWAVVGCYEAVPQGDCYPNTVLGGLHLVELLQQYSLATSVSENSSFAAFYCGYISFLDAYYNDKVLPECQEKWSNFSENAPSPFGSLLLQNCLERVQPLECGGARYSLAGINILGLGTAVDSLTAIEEMVFRQQELSLQEFIHAVEMDFPDEALRLRLCHMHNRFGTDSAITNERAAGLSKAVADIVLESRLAHGVRPYPGFFRFSADIYAVDCPSADGRRRGDLISYGVSPASAAAVTPTSAMASAAHIAHDRAACGNPLLLNLPPADCRSEDGAAFIKHLVCSYFKLGGSHVHFNIVTPELLRAAQDNPEEYASLTVRVSGYSARFTTIDKQWQDALIKRAEKGRATGPEYEMPLPGLSR